VEAEERQSSLRSSYDRLKNEFGKLHEVAATLQREKSEVEKSHEAEVTAVRKNFQRYRV
jgi:uncharacterized protein involved in exopolysaccharide biosynthesis